MQNIIKADSVVPDKSVWMAQANLGQHFKQMH